MRAMRARACAAGGLSLLAVLAGAPFTGARAARALAPAPPVVDVHVATVALANIGAHRGVTVTSTCPAGSRLVGGGGLLRRASAPDVLPTNGLVLGGTVPSTGAAPVDVAAADGAADLSSWMSIANYTGVSEAGNEALTFALCASAGGPSQTVVRSSSRTGTLAAQEVDAPHLATATCGPGTRLIGGGATTSTTDQVNDGVTPGNNGNLKPLGSYPSDAAGVAAAGGSTDATSWSAYGSAGIGSATDTVTALALCSSDPGTPPVQVARTDVDGADAQAGTTTTTASAGCPAGARLLGGGYGVDETVGTTSGLQPQQGYHMRGSYPGSAAVPAQDGSQADTWTALVQAGGQNLATGKHMTTRAFALCATVPASPGPPPPPAAMPPPPPAAMPPPPPAVSPPPPSLPPSSAFKIAGVRADRRGRIVLRLSSPGSGRFAVTVTVRRGKRSYRFATRSIAVRGRRTSTLTIPPGARARRELRHRALRVSVAVSFRPVGGRSRTITRQITIARVRAR
jgi:hypothetical protein